MVIAVFSVLKLYSIAKLIGKSNTNIQLNLKLAIVHIVMLLIQNVEVWSQTVLSFYSK